MKAINSLLVYSVISLIMHISVTAFSQTIVNGIEGKDFDNLLILDSESGLYKCAAGSISIDSNGVCINVLTADQISVTDILTASLSAADSIVGQETVTTLSVQDIFINNSLNVSPFSTVGIVHNSAAGLLSSSLIINADVDPAAAIDDSKLATMSTAGKVANSATTATNANTASTIVARDASGNCAVTMLTLNGSTTNATDAATKSYVDSAVSGSGTSANTANTLVMRNASGNFSAGSISITDSVVGGNLVLTTEPSTSGAGNIVKGTNAFIHDFGTSNTFVGINAGNFTMSGSGQNSALGKNALTANTTGNNNTAIGFNALNSCTTGTSNVAIGSNAGTTLTTGSNNIYICANAGTSSEAATTRIGVQGTQTTCFIAGVRGVSLTLSGLAVVVDSNGQFGTILSSEKFKRNIKNMNSSSENIFKLRPVTFTYKADEMDTEQFGLIAEEVARVFPAIVARDENNEVISVQYHILPVLLLNEIQKQQTTMEHMLEVIASLQGQVQSCIERIKLLEANA